ncbi:MAG: hypothetical protein MJZ62_01075 [Bacteroidales bacterium]|nr:hypothetical protein [Bacteroidales bacterium]
MKKQIVFFDMDNVLVDFPSALELPEVKSLMPQYTLSDGTTHFDDIPGIFSHMKPMEGAVEAVKTIAQKYKVYILSTAPWHNPSAWSDKLEWVKRHFDSEEEGGVFYKRLILSHHKDLCYREDAYLIDDRPTKNGADRFGDNLLHFHKENGRFKTWNEVVEYLMNE